MKGILSKNKRLTPNAIRQHLPLGVHPQVSARNWRGIKVDTIISGVEQNGLRMVVYTIQIPLVPSAVQLGVTGPESKRAKLDRLADTLLASFKGETNW